MKFDSNEYFGSNAGEVYECLAKNDGMTIPEIKKETGLSEKQIHFGLGWLGKEGKVAVKKAGKKILFILG